MMATSYDIVVEYIYIMISMNLMLSKSTFLCQTSESN